MLYAPLLTFVSWLILLPAIMSLSTVVPLPMSLRFWAPLACSLLPLWHVFKLLRAADWRLRTVLLALFAVVSWLAMGAAHAVWHGRLEAFKFQLRGQGMLASLADLKEDLPDQAYAQPELENLIEGQDLADYTKVKRYSTQGLPKFTKEDALREADYVKKKEPFIIKELAPCLAKGYTRYFKADFVKASEAPFRMPLPRFQHFIAMGGTISLSALSRAERGDMKQAWELVALHLRFADLVGSEPSLIGKMIAVALRGQAVKTALVIMLSRPSAAIPAGLVPRLSAADPARWVSQGLQNETAGLLDTQGYIERVTFQDIRRNGTAISFADRPATFSGALTEYLLCAVLRQMGYFDLNSLVSSRALSRLGGMGSWAELRSQAAQSEAEKKTWTPWPHALALIESPNFGKLQSKGREALAWARMALIVSDLGLRHAKTGKLPRDLAGVLAEDPFSGGPFAYSADQDGKGFELCSAGAAGDRKDSAGLPLCVRQRY